MHAYNHVHTYICVPACMYPYLSYLYNMNNILYIATKAIGLITTHVQQEKERSSKEREKEETHRGEETEVSRRTNCS